MKKLMAIMMALLLVCAAAAAEAELVQFASGAGYSLWYDDALLEARSDEINDCFYPAGTAGDSDVVMLVVPVEIEPEYGHDLIYEATGGYGEECTVSEIVEETLENGISMSTVEARYENTVDRYYLIMDDQNVLCITVTCSEEEEAVYGEYFDAMVRSIEFVAD